MERSEISAEVHFAQKLASNEKKIRDRAIKRLRKYLFARSSHGGLTENDVVKIWKGLHYCMWMQDKPLLQEELSQKISGLLSSFSSPEGALLFIKVFLETEAREWNGIDKLRLDKFMMMIRDVLHQGFTLLSGIGWPTPECRQFAEAVALKVMLPGEPRLPDGLKLHLADIYVDELRKVPLDKMSSRNMVLLLRPFIDFLVYTSKSELANRVMQEVIRKVLDTMSTVKCSTPSNPSSEQGDEEEDEEQVDDEEIDEDMEIKGDKMEVDEESETAENENNFEVDADVLLFLLFKLAKDPKVKAKNRALVYNLVKKYPETYDNIVNTLSSSSDIIRAKDDPGGSNIKLDELTLFLKDGPGKDQQQQQEGKKKKRKGDKNSKGEKEGEAADSLADLQTSVEPGNVNEQARKGKKSKETKQGLIEESSKPLKRKRDSEEDADSGGDLQRSKSMKYSPDGTVESQSTDLSPSAHKTKLKKKKKNKEGGNTPPSPTVLSTPEPSNLSSAGHIDADDGETAPTDKNSNARDAPTRSPRKTSAITLSSPVELVIYPKKNPPVSQDRRKEKSKKKHRVARVEIDENMHLRSTNTEGPLQFLERQRSRSPSPSSTSLSSSALAMSLFTTAADRKKSSKKGRKPSPSASSSNGLSDDTAASGECASDTTDSKVSDNCHCKYTKTSGSEGAEGGVVEGVKSVFSSIKQKYVDPLILAPSKSHSMDNARSESSMEWSVGTMNSPSVSASFSVQDTGDDGDDTTISTSSYTDPGPNRKKAKCNMEGDSSFATPYGKKRVVFNLRRNQANKFQDYIKSLQRQPESPHVPGKSPSNGILKPGLTPSPSSASGKKKKAAAGKWKVSPTKKKNQRDSSSSPSPRGKTKSVRSR